MLFLFKDARMQNLKCITGIMNQLQLGLFQLVIKNNNPAGK